ncbi:MAG: hypothetical protein V3W34_03365 [Phycisphaerae bacterium]
MHEGELRRAEVRDPQVKHLLACYEGKAEDQLREERYKREGMAYFKPTVWEFAVQELRESFTKEMDDVEDRLRCYCANVAPEDGSGPLSTEIARLDDEWFAKRVLAAIWEKYPAQAAEMELARSTENLPTISNNEAAQLYANWAATKPNPSWISKLIRAGDKRLPVQSDVRTTEDGVAILVGHVLRKRRPSKAAKESGNRKNWKYTCPRCGERTWKLIGAATECYRCFDSRILSENRE